MASSTSDLRISRIDVVPRRFAPEHAGKRSADEPPTGPGPPPQLRERWSSLPEHPRRPTDPPRRRRAPPRSAASARGTRRASRRPGRAAGAGRSRARARRPPDPRPVPVVDELRVEPTRVEQRVERVHTLARGRRRRRRRRRRVRRRRRRGGVGVADLSAQPLAPRRQRFPFSVHRRVAITLGARAHRRQVALLLRPRRRARARSARMCASSASRAARRSARSTNSRSWGRRRPRRRRGVVRR